MHPVLLSLLQSSVVSHRVLPTDFTRTNTYRLLQKTPMESRLLDDMQSLDAWEAISEHAFVSLSDEQLFEGKKTLKFCCPTNLPDWHASAAGVGRIYAEPAVRRHFDRENWETWNRLSIWVYPDISGMFSICLRLQLRNDGKEKVPDRWGRAGHHNFDLKAGKWNHVTLEIPMVARDAVTSVSLEYDMVGHENTADHRVTFYLARLELEKVDADREETWAPRKGLIVLSGSGYLPEDHKTAVTAGSEDRHYTITEASSGRTVFRGTIQHTRLRGVDLGVMDFSELRAHGLYCIQAGTAISAAFSIAPDVYEPSAWKVLNFFFSQRCGMAIPGKHRACHADLLLVHGKQSIVANGGWHDAADLAQGMANTADATAALFLLADRCRKHPALYQRVLEEAQWGLDYVLKTRFGDGFRSEYSSASIWTDGIIGTEDDLVSHATENPANNFVSAFAEACGAFSLREEDPALASYALRLAREDFAFGRKQCERALKDDPALHVSFDEVQLFAEGLSAAAALLRAGDESVLADAVTFADLLIQCQQQDAPDWEIPLYGFYYTDRTHRLPLHHAHHSFEQYTTVGLEMLLKACPEHEHAARWRAALQRSADYYRALSSFTEPYGILPEGVYFADEAERWPEETLRHIIWGDEACLRDFRPQVENGFCLDRASQVYLRVFPVWFSFRGNCNVQLSEAVAAASAGTAVGDLRLLEIARRQLAWITGMNPFGQSLLYGEGPEWTDEYTVQSGVTVGQIPVGMQTYQHHDVPWWPQVTTATYKEVWIASALKWMWTLSYILDES